MTTVPVQAGQSRRGGLGVVWGVWKPHPTRPGFWICASQEFAYDLAHLGRRELEAMPLLPNEYWGPDGGHPGIAYWRQLASMTVTRHRP